MATGPPRAAKCELVGRRRNSEKRDCYLHSEPRLLGARAVTMSARMRRALAVALLIADQLGSSRYVISHAVEAVYGGPHLFVTGTSTAADNKLYEEALAAGRVMSLDEWYRAKLLAQYVESGQCPDAATSEWCAKNAPR